MRVIFWMCYCKKNGDELNGCRVFDSYGFKKVLNKIYILRSNYKSFINFILFWVYCIVCFMIVGKDLSV